MLDLFKLGVGLVGLAVDGVKFLAELLKLGQNGGE